jgi:hypothetical protein
MRISSKVVCRLLQRKSQAMTNTIGSDSEMPNSNTTTRGHRPGAGPSRRSSRIARSAGWPRPWRWTGPFAPRNDLGGLPLSQLAQGSSDMSF